MASEASASEPLTAAQLMRIARHIHTMRQMRAQTFGYRDLFGEPAWDLLLDLFIAAREDKRLAISSACIGAGVPTTTALRWIHTLEMRGMVVRESDPQDARRVFVRLTDQADGAMERYIAQVSIMQEPANQAPAHFPREGEVGGREISC